MVDPNCRPGLIADRKAYRARLDRVLARADLLKASVEDLAYLEPDARPAEAARRLGAPAIVTAGAEGALAVTRDDVIEVPARRVRVADTIGAGDSFGGGVLAWWTERGLTQSALRGRRCSGPGRRVRHSRRRARRRPVREPTHHGRDRCETRPVARVCSCRPSRRRTRWSSPTAAARCSAPRTSTRRTRCRPSGMRRGAASSSSSTCTSPATASRSSSTTTRSTARRRRTARTAAWRSAS